MSGILNRTVFSYLPRAYVRSTYAAPPPGTFLFSSLFPLFALFSCGIRWLRHFPFNLAASAS